MADFSSISNIVQNNIGNYLGIGSSNRSGPNKPVSAVNPVNSSNNQAITSAAAKILNSSPLELNDGSATAHLKKNPYQYGTVTYPAEITNLDSGHYMLFDIYLNNKTKFITNKQGNTFINTDAAATKVWNINENNSSKLGFFDAMGYVIPGSPTFGNATSDYNNYKARQVKLTKYSSGRQSGIQAKNNTHAIKSDTIVLYTPPQIKTTYGTSYDTPETGQAGKILGGQTAGDYLRNIGNFLGIALREFTLGAISALPSAGDPAAALVKKTGEAKNPNLEVVFKSVPFRKFQYVFEFAPRNPKEVENIQKILQLFRFHMQPELQGGNSSFFTVPSEFQITYMYIDKENSYIPRISRCVLESMELDQSPENVFSTFSGDVKGAFPTLTKMTLSFTETEIMTKQKIADGY
jgi:hypothetical protein